MTLENILQELNHLNRTASAILSHLERERLNRLEDEYLNWLGSQLVGAAVPEDFDIPPEIRDSERVRAELSRLRDKAQGLKDYGLYSNPHGRFQWSRK